MTVRNLVDLEPIVLAPLDSKQDGLMLDRAPLHRAYTRPGLCYSPRVPAAVAERMDRAPADTLPLLDAEAAVGLDRDLHFLNGLMRDLAEAGLDQQAILDVLTRRLVGVLGEVCVVRFFTPDERSLLTAAVHHEDPDVGADLRALLVEPYPVSADRLAGPTDGVAYLPSTPRFRAAAVATAPLRAGGRPLGTLDVAREAGAPYTPAEETLLQEVADRAAVLLDHARAFGEAVDALRIRDDVLSAVSHDLKAPLTVIDVTAQLMEREVNDGGINPRLVRRIMDASHRMAASLTELVDVARLQMGESLRLELAPLELVALVRQAAGDHQQAAPRHTVVVETDLPELVGMWDATRLRRALDNLVSNAVKYSPAGSQVTVRIQRVQQDDQAWAQVEIADQGVGIPAADLPHVFERFRRGANVGRVGGAGIGLAVVEGIVRQHGGAVSAASKEQEGSCFTLRLPLDTVLAPPPAPPVFQR